jgi:hypothetical protein
MLVLKAIAAFCLGAAMLAGVQHAYVWSVQRQLKSAQASAGPLRMPRTPDFAANFRASGIRDAILPKVGAIDTTTGQRLAIENAARRVDLQIRAAQSAVPVMSRIYLPRR